MPKDPRTKQQEIVAEEFDEQIEKIKCSRGGSFVYICPFRLTSNRADCYNKVKQGEGLPLWIK